MIQSPRIKVLNPGPTETGAWPAWFLRCMSVILPQWGESDILLPWGNAPCHRKPHRTISTPLIRGKEDFPRKEGKREEKRELVGETEGERNKDSNTEKLRERETEKEKVRERERKRERDRERENKENRDRTIGAKRQTSQAMRNPRGL